MPDELYGILSADERIPFPVIDVIARMVDGSDFDELQAGVGIVDRLRLLPGSGVTRSASSPTTGSSSPSRR